MLLYNILDLFEHDFDLGWIGVVELKNELLLVETRRRYRELDLGDIIIFANRHI